MSARPEEHEQVRDLLFNRWAPYVRDKWEESPYANQTIEQTLMLYGGQPPDRGYPPEWPEDAVIIEQEVSSMRGELKGVVLVEFGIIRDEEGYRLKSKKRFEAVHMSHKKYFTCLSSAMDVLWHARKIQNLLVVA